MRTVEIAGGDAVSCLGQGTWNMGEHADQRADEIAAMRLGVELGMGLIDTAEMYGDGATELLVGEAIAGLRDDVFLVSKAYPQNASRERLPVACDASLKRLGTDRIDLYLLHWRGRVPLSETIDAMTSLKQAGKIRHWGVSNLDTADMEELVEHGGASCVTDQVLYNLTRRGPEHDLLPWLDQNGMSAMAYSPVEQGRLIDDEELAALASDVGLTPSQFALAWVLRRPEIIAIPKAGRIEHVRENRAAADTVLSSDTLARLDELFPPPSGKTQLEML